MGIPSCVQPQLNSQPANRRWLIPLIVLLVGGAIALWASSRETRRIQDIDQMITGLCHDIAAGSDVSARVDQATGAPNARLEAQLRQACSAPDALHSLDVHVTPGDYAQTGSFQGTATHTAIIRVAGIEVLGLRIRHNGFGKPIEILGYFKPAVS